jgi:hypothetical protein
MLLRIREEAAKVNLSCVDRRDTLAQEKGRIARMKIVHAIPLGRGMNKEMFASEYVIQGIGFSHVSRVNHALAFTSLAGAAFRNGLRTLQRQSVGD